MTDRLGSFVLIPNNSTSESDRRAVIRTGSGEGIGRVRATWVVARGRAVRRPLEERGEIPRHGAAMTSREGSSRARARARSTSGAPPTACSRGMASPASRRPCLRARRAARGRAALRRARSQHVASRRPYHPAPSHRTAPASKPRRVAKGQIPTRAGSWDSRARTGFSPASYVHATTLLRFVGTDRATSQTGSGGVGQQPGGPTGSRDGPLDDLGSSGLLSSNRHSRVRSVFSTLRQCRERVETSSPRSRSRPCPPEQHVRSSALRSWALRDSNPRPSPCKGDRNMQVSGLTSRNLVTLSTSEYLRVLLSRGAGVVQVGSLD
jgi:hypothetical protein